MLRMKIETTPKRSRLMVSVRQLQSSLEISIRRIVDSCGINYETNAKDLLGTPDYLSVLFFR